MASQALDQAIAEKGVYSIGIRIIRPDGEIVWVDSKRSGDVRRERQPMKWSALSWILLPASEAEEELRLLEHSRYADRSV